MSAVRIWRRRAPAALRVGLGPGALGGIPGTGDGTVWAKLVEALRARDDVELAERGRCDVWLASGHAEPPPGRPLVVQVHEVSWEDPALAPFLGGDFATQIAAATRASVEAAAAVIVPSQVARRQVIDAYGVPPERVHAVHHGVDHQLFRPGVAGGRELVGRPYVLSVAVIHPRKNLGVLARAVARLGGGEDEPALAIVGNPARDRPDPAALERELDEDLRPLGRRAVRLRDVGDRELAALMAGADAFCLPSLFEGFGLPALEALASGVPVIVSDRGALPEVVGPGGLVVEPAEEAIAAALADVLGNPERARALRAGAVERARAFSWERTAEGWIEALRAAAPGRREDRRR
jgi:glycosyltransferase involved in cell wall biosynthesis